MGQVGVKREHGNDRAVEYYLSATKCKVIGVAGADGKLMRLEMVRIGGEGLVDGVVGLKIIEIAQWAACTPLLDHI